MTENLTANVRYLWPQQSLLRSIRLHNGYDGIRVDLISGELRDRLPTDVLLSRLRTFCCMQMKAFPAIDQHKFLVPCVKWTCILLTLTPL